MSLSRKMHLYCVLFAILNVFSINFIVIAETINSHRSEHSVGNAQNERGYFSNFFNWLLSRPDNDIIHNGNCLTCGSLGHREAFNSPLYDECDVVLLESLFDENFKYGMSFLHNDYSCLIHAIVYSDCFFAGSSTILSCIFSHGCVVVFMLLL